MFMDILLVILRELFQIFVLWFLIYWFLRLLKGTAVPMIIYTFISVIGVTYYIVTFLRLPVLKWCIENISFYLPFVLIILMRDELRKMVGMLKNTIFKSFAPTRKSSTFDEVTTSALCADVIKMSRSKIGALIAIEQNMSLEHIVIQGKAVNAVLIPGDDLLETIFYKGSPLHDGGVVIKGGKIVGASCTFPLCDNSDIQQTCGTRHQAAYGLSEKTDALVIVVSEEDGSIQLIHNCIITKIKSQEHLQTEIRKYLALEERRDPFWLAWLKAVLNRLKALGRLMRRKSQQA